MAKSNNSGKYTLGLQLLQQSTCQSIFSKCYCLTWRCWICKCTIKASSILIWYFTQIIVFYQYKYKA
jgi:hypothetical protein